MAALYSGGFSLPTTFQNLYTAPFSNIRKLNPNSFSAQVVLTATENFKLTIGGTLSLSFLFNANIAGTLGYSYGINAGGSAAITSSPLVAKGLQTASSETNGPTFAAGDYP